MNAPTPRYAAFAFLITVALAGFHGTAIAQEVAAVSQSGQVVARSAASGQPAEARLRPGPFEVRLPRVEVGNGVYACASTNPASLVNGQTAASIGQLECFEPSSYTYQEDGPVQSMFVGVGDNHLYFRSDDRTDSASSTLLQFRGFEYVHGATGPFYLTVILDKDSDGILDRGEYYHFRVEPVRLNAATAPPDARIAVAVQGGSRPADPARPASGVTTGGGVAEREPTTLGDLRQGMLYSEARAVVLAAGWQTEHVPWQNRYWLTQGTDGGREQDYVERGWDELRTCSGTGRGLCWFEFRDAGGQQLAVQTSGEGDDPSLSEWTIVPPASIVGVWSDAGKCREYVYVFTPEGYYFEMGADRSRTLHSEIWNVVPGMYDVTAARRPPFRLSLQGNWSMHSSEMDVTSITESEVTGQFVDFDVQGDRDVLTPFRWVRCRVTADDGPPF